MRQIRFHDNTGLTKEVKKHKGELQECINDARKYAKQNNFKSFTIKANNCTIYSGVIL